MTHSDEKPDNPAAVQATPPSPDAHPTPPSPLRDTAGGPDADHGAGNGTDGGADTAIDKGRRAPRFGLPLRGNPKLPLRGDSTLTRCLLVFGLTALLLRPLAHFSDLVDERAMLYQETIHNIAERWGAAQTISGPALIIPYVSRDYFEYAEREKGGRGTRHLVVLPRRVSFTARLASQTRYKGIYRYVVYTTPVAIEGSYELPQDGPIADSRNLFLWDQAYFSVGVSDLKAIGSMGELNWEGGKAAAFSPGSESADLLGPGFHAKAPLRPDRREYAFSMQISLNGSGGIYFTPVGESTDITISGDWPSPNFDGTILAGRREITPDGFTAEWHVPHISRDYPQSGDPAAYRDGRGSAISAFTAGVSLHESVPLYRQITRSVKYGALFIGLTFTALLGFELLSRTRLHLVQYGLVGVAMCVFYLVLLSLAEHAAFWQAFALASAVCVFMNGLYITAAFRSKGKGLLIALLLSLLYGVLYALLQTEEYAVLLGTALVVGVLCVLMYLTRNLNRPEADGGPPADHVPGAEQGEPADRGGDASPDGAGAAAGAGTPRQESGGEAAGFSPESSV